MVTAFEAAYAYGTVYKWVDHLYEKNIFVTGYFNMPNYVHLLLYFPRKKKWYSEALAGKVKAVGL